MAKKKWNLLALVLDLVNHWSPKRSVPTKSHSRLLTHLIVAVHLKNKLAGDAILVYRGNCSFTTKANVAENAGASAILIINNHTELFKMVCEVNETDVQIGIPAVMFPIDAGQSLSAYIQNKPAVTVQLYSPQHTVVDMAEVFLWLMAVGTILCASYWSAWTAREAAIELDKLLKDG